jgi:hypothetical protein
MALGLFNLPREAYQHIKQLLKASEPAKVVNFGRDALSSVNDCAARLAEFVSLVRRSAEQADAVSFISRLDSDYSTSPGSMGSPLNGGWPRN